jgi:zinc protease
MISYTRFELANGLRILAHEDNSTPMVCVNILYDVGSRDENPDKTGFAHLFEHLMFGGSKHIPDFDDPIQMAGGENNAFTNSDYTNFYEVMPAHNLETAFWLESDRMLSLSFDPKVLRVQKKVVVEEFKETCLNQPYGDSWHLISALAYRQHPYRWPTIGLEPGHIEQASMKDVRDFFFHHYRPNNAILSVAGNVPVEEVKRLAEKWFGDIPPGNIPKRHIPREPRQQEFRQYIQHAAVPVPLLYMGFHMPDRFHPDYYAVDLLSDALCNGQSSRLYRRLMKEKQLFASIDCYITGTIDPGLFIIEGKPAEGVSIAQCREAIWQELEAMKAAPIAPKELEKLKNKTESNLLFSEISIMTKASSLAFYELLGDANMINTEGDHYNRVSAEDIQRVAQDMLTRINCSEIIYQPLEAEATPES